VNDPEVVFLDEPMSALDPLGRRDVRALVLQLRDRGCTVFFSSHILPDAEAVCSRVGILANGRLLTAGRLSEILAGDVRGWELVVEGVTANALAPFATRATRVTRITDERHALALPATAAPEQVVAELAAAGVRVLSLTPVHPTLEEYFVERVTSRLSERRS
jgi:ABC-2 type transport system ATP-binding protein